MQLDARTPVLSATQVASQAADFSSFSFHPVIQANLSRQNFATPTPIQVQAIPVVMEGRDLIGLAQTGTGKTAAFVLPIVQKLLSQQARGLRVLIVVPTRELAEQVQEVILDFTQDSNIRSMTIYGGVGMDRQVERLRRGVDIVVACPGRLLDHVQQRTISLQKIEMLVLDEADQMFDMGFLPSIKQILRVLPSARQSMLFSATMPPDIRSLAAQVLRNPETVQVNFAKPVESVSHALFNVSQQRKTGLLMELLRSANSQSVLVFTRTKHRAKKLSQHLQNKGFKATSLQGNLSQNKRQFAINGFKSGEFDILVATDIAARGIDISSVSHVINYDVPMTPDLYTHRIGRTGRASRTGDAFTFVTPEDNSLVRAIERALGSAIPRKQLPEFVDEPMPAGGSFRDRDDRPARPRGGYGRRSDSSQRPPSRNRRFGSRRGPASSSDSRSPRVG